MKNTITFAPLALACLLLSACSHSHDQTEQPSTESYLSLGEFPASRDVAKNIPVARYDEIFITKEVSTDIAQLKLHAHVLRKKLQAEGTTLKTTHAQELVACKHGFSNWQAAIAGLKS